MTRSLTSNERSERNIMKIVRYVIIITLLCYSQLALSGNDLVEAIIEQNKPWLAEQLQQLNYIEVGNPIVYELVDYFCSITNNFFNDLMDQGKEISTDLFQT